MSEYGWTIEYAMRVPLRRALCLHAAIALREGWEWKDLSYEERDV
jgi:hypothetical protein